MVTNQLSTDDIDALSSIDEGVFHVPGDWNEESYVRALAHGLVEEHKFRMTHSPGVRRVYRCFRRTPAGDAFLKALAGEAPHV